MGQGTAAYHNIGPQHLSVKVLLSIKIYILGAAIVPVLANWLMIS